MIFARERAEVIADKLKKLMVVRKFELDSWQVKEGFFCGRRRPTGRRKAGNRLTAV